MAIDLIQFAIWIAVGFGLGVIFMEVRMSIFGRINALEATLATLAAANMAKVEGAIETVTIEAFDGLKAVVADMTAELAALKAAIGDGSDGVSAVTPTPETTAPDATTQEIAPAAAEATAH